VLAAGSLFGTRHLSDPIWQYQALNLQQAGGSLDTTLVVKFSCGLPRHGVARPTWASRFQHAVHCQKRVQGGVGLLSPLLRACWASNVSLACCMSLLGGKLSVQTDLWSGVDYWCCP
jgi:hypothetical protein